MHNTEAFSYLVSTDLDGTLLDHFSYEWLAAKPSLDKLEELSIPVIINTSKTFEEVVALQQSMSLCQPFIVENGSGVYFPISKYPDQPTGAIERNGHWQAILGKPREQIVNILQQLRLDKKWNFKGFSDMSIQHVIDLTGLTSENAQLALQRSFSEPLVWHDDEQSYRDFVGSVEAKNLRVIKGGRFVHILGQTDKGHAITWCKNHMESLTQQKLKLIALGDSPNDIDMLNIADHPVLVKSPTHSYPVINSSKTALLTHGFGPIGWHEAIQGIIFSE